MFEDSLFASRNRVASPNTRWTTAFSLVVQTLLATAIIVFPLLHPTSLPNRSNAIRLALPLPKQPPPTVIERAARAASAASSLIPAVAHFLQAPRIASTHIDASPDPTPSTVFGSPLGASTLPGALFSGDTGTTPRVSITPAVEKKAGPVRVSAGVSAGLLLTPIRPVYPQIARAAHVEGSVVVAATISKTGAIESLRVVSGPAMLQSAALDAIRAARYQPFQLNGEPTEVQTTITVNFKLSS